MGFALGSLPDINCIQSFDGPTFQERNFYARFSSNNSTKFRHLWLRWRNEYLASLREYHRNNKIKYDEKIPFGQVIL